MALVERPSTHWWPTVQAVFHIRETDTQHLQRWLQTSAPMRAADIEQLSGIWKGESMQEGGTSPTIWGETEMTFTRENNTCRLKGAGTSKWHGQSIEFRLVGTIDPTNMRFEMYKTHIGAFNNTILFKGRVELTPPRLVGNSLKGTVTLERIQNRPSAGQDYYQQHPTDSEHTTVFEHSRHRNQSDADTNSDVWVKRQDGLMTPSRVNPVPMYSAMPLTPQPQTMHLRKDNSFRESLRQQTDKISLQDGMHTTNPLLLDSSTQATPTTTTPLKLEVNSADTAYTRVTYCDVMTPAMGIFPDRVPSNVMADWQLPEGMATPTPGQSVIMPERLLLTPSLSSSDLRLTTPSSNNNNALSSPERPSFPFMERFNSLERERLNPLNILPPSDRDASPSRKRQELDSPREQQPREKDGYPTCPPENSESLAPLSPTGNPQLSTDHSRDYEPHLRPSAKTMRTGDSVTDAANLCGVWHGASRKKTVSHPTGEVTEWNDVVMYFNLKQGSTGNIRGRGESVWRSTVIPFLLEGTFDLDQSTVHLRKIHVGKFNNIVPYDLVLGPSEDFLRLTLAGDDGSLELKQGQQVHDRPCRSPQVLSPEANSVYPQHFLLPQPANSSPGGPQGKTNGPIPGGTVYTALAANSMLPSRLSISSPSFSSLQPLFNPSQPPPVYTMLPVAAMEEAPPPQELPSDRPPVYTMLPVAAMEEPPPEQQESRGVTARDQQQALATYRVNNNITDQEHQLSLQLLNLTPKEFERKLRTRSDDMCKVCYERPIDCVLLPCGHLTTCVKCSGKLAQCPVCRQAIVETKRVFRS